MLVIDSSAKSKPAQQAKNILKRALYTKDLREKIRLVSEASQLDEKSVEPLIVRGQIYLRLISLAYSQHEKPRGLCCIYGESESRLRSGSATR
jgi:hypothetical protein